MMQPYSTLLYIIDSYLHGQSLKWTRTKVKMLSRMDYGRLILIADEKGMDLEEFIYKITEEDTP